MSGGHSGRRERGRREREIQFVFTLLKRIKWICPTTFPRLGKTFFYNCTAAHMWCSLCYCCAVCMHMRCFSNYICTFKFRGGRGCGKECGNVVLRYYRIQFFSPHFRLPHCTFEKYQIPKYQNFAKYLSFKCLNLNAKIAKS